MIKRKFLLFFSVFTAIVTFYSCSVQTNDEGTPSLKGTGTLNTEAESKTGENTKSSTPGSTPKTDETSDKKTESLESLKKIYEETASNTRNEILKVLGTIEALEGDKKVSTDLLLKELPTYVKDYFSSGELRPLEETLNENSLTALHKHLCGMIKQKINQIALDNTHSLNVSFSGNNPSNEEKFQQSVLNSCITDNVSSTVKECIEKINNPDQTAAEDELYSLSFKENFASEIKQTEAKIIENIKKDIKQQTYALLTKDMQSALNSDTMAKLIPESIKKLIDKNIAPSRITIILSSQSFRALESNLNSALKGPVNNGLKIKHDDSLSSQNGFIVRIAASGEEKASEYSCMPSSLAKHFMDNLFKFF